MRSGSRFPLWLMTIVLTGALGAPTVATEPGSSPSRETLSTVRRVGTALFYWMTDRIQRLSEEERAAMKAKSAAMSDAEREAAIARGTWVDPKSLTPDEMLRLIAEPKPEGVDLLETEPISEEQVRAMIREVGFGPEIAGTPLVDGWGRPLDVRMDPDNLLHHTVVVVRSAGENGQFESPPYHTAGFAPNARVDDIVWIDGYFHRWPELEGDFFGGARGRAPRYGLEELDQSDDPPGSES